MEVSAPAVVGVTGRTQAGAELVWIGVVGRLLAAEDHPPHGVER